MSIGKFNVNTLLAMLNSRQQLRSKTVSLRDEVEITQYNSHIVSNQLMPLRVKCIDSRDPSSPIYVDKI
ncbi:hypothetical protein BD410DRAFT_796560, partial [Rickenella mellea]